jgi:hypothetical protein
MAGEFDAGGNNLSLDIDTNAVVLEALLYKPRGQCAFLTDTEHRLWPTHEGSRCGS